MSPKNTLMILLLTLTAIGFSSCMKRPTSADKGAKLLQIEKSQSQDLTAEAGTPEALCNYLSSAGYYKGNTYAAGTTVAFSTSYGVDSQNANTAESGQAHGEILSDGFYSQTENPTQQALICPGTSEGLFARGKCAWKMSGDDGYAELARRVVCNTAATYGAKGRLHPGYLSMKTSKVSFKANTAGKSFAYSDAVEVELVGQSSTAHIYFAKDFGLVATEFRETSMPGGTAKVYIGAGQN